MEYKNEIQSFDDLYDLCWSGARYRMQEIDELGCQSEFMDYLETIFSDRIPELVEINDFIWFEVDDWIEEHKIEDIIWG